MNYLGYLNTIAWNALTLTKGKHFVTLYGNNYSALSSFIAQVFGDIETSGGQVIDWKVVINDSVVTRTISGTVDFTSSSSAVSLSDEGNSEVECFCSIIFII